MWDEAHVLRLRVPKGKTDQVNKIVITAIGVWERKLSVSQKSVHRERRAGEEIAWLGQRHDGGVGSEGVRVEGEGWWIASSHSGWTRATGVVPATTANSGQGKHRAGRDSLGQLRSAGAGHDF
jgi:hypothetical protein